MKRSPKKYRLVSFIVAGLCVFNLSVFEAHAETTEDLFNIYDVDLGGVSLPTIQTALEQVQRQLTEAEEEQHRIDWVNSSIETAQLMYEKKEAEVLEKASEMMADNLLLKSSIEKDIYGDIDTLITRDSVYKSNTLKINTVLSELDSYSNISYLNSIDIDIEEIMKEYDDVISQYQIAVDVYELGDVTNVEYVMDRSMYVTSDFGVRIDPLNPGTTRFHAGLDLRAETGTPVKCLFNGVISGCGWSDTSGYWIRVEHGDNIKTFYCHLSEIQCEVGQQVSQYDIIALSGATGSRCTGPHLHLGLYINGNAVDPALLFEQE